MMTLYITYTFLKPSHMEVRQKWADEHWTWGKDDWQRVIWTDKTSIELGKDSRRVWVWRNQGERYNSSCIVPSFKSGRQSLMVWGCIAHGRRGPLVRMPKDERKGTDYVRLILAGPLWDFYRDLFDERGIMAVMEDGAPIHRCAAAKNFHANHHIEVFSHLAQSPDLNPIEHVWKRL